MKRSIFFFFTSFVQLDIFSKICWGLKADLAHLLATVTKDVDGWKFCSIHLIKRNYLQFRIKLDCWSRSCYFSFRDLFCLNKMNWTKTMLFELRLEFVFALMTNSFVFKISKSLPMNSFCWKRSQKCQKGKYHTSYELHCTILICHLL